MLFPLMVLSFFAFQTGFSQPSDKQTKHVLMKEITVMIRLEYLLYLPDGYDRETEKRWPLILFLHGAGERGNNLDLVKTHGPPKIVEQQDLPFVIVSPQCPADEWWSPEILDKLLDEVLIKHRIDPGRIYLTGLSMGGYGTWTLATQYPDRFAAITPICGGGDTTLVQTIRHIPVWVFHGAKDPVVPLQRSEEMVGALKRAGADVKFTVYPEAGHDSWTETYDNPELYEWFLTHRK